MLISTGKAQAL